MRGSARAIKFTVEGGSAIVLKLFRMRHISSNRFVDAMTQLVAGSAIHLLIDLNSSMLPPLLEEKKQ